MPYTEEDPSFRSTTIRPFGHLCSQYPQHLQNLKLLISTVFSIFNVEHEAHLYYHCHCLLPLCGVSFYLSPLQVGLLRQDRMGEAVKLPIGVSSCKCDKVEASKNCCNTIDNGIWNAKHHKCGFVGTKKGVKGKGAKFSGCCKARTGHPSVYA